MKCLIIYSSQTGNTEKVAKAIYAGVKEAAGNCNLVKIKDANPRRLYEYDLIGLGSPVFTVEPDNVGAFIKDLWSVGGKHIFLFTTHRFSHLQTNEWWQNDTLPLSLFRVNLLFTPFL